MTHDELLAKLSNDENGYAGSTPLQRVRAVRAVVELHKPGKPDYDYCLDCGDGRGPYPCATLEAIEKELG